VTEAALGRTIPALPARDMRAAVAHHRERFGFDALDALFAELEPAGVLHPTSHGSVSTADFGTRELDTLDRDGNLLTFFRRVEG
jgi:hypothetical protein